MYTYDFGASSKSSLILQNCDFYFHFLLSYDSYSYSLMNSGYYTQL